METEVRMLHQTTEERVREIIQEVIKKNVDSAEDNHDIVRKSLEKVKKNLKILKFSEIFSRRSS